MIALVVRSFRSPYRRARGTFSSCAATEPLRWSHFASRICLYELLARFFAYFALSRRYAAAIAHIHPVPALLSFRERFALLPLTPSRLRGCGPYCRLVLFKSARGVATKNACRA